MSAPFTLAEAAQLVRREGGDPNTWEGARRAGMILCNPPAKLLQLTLADELLAQAHEMSQSAKAEAVTVAR
ncbi:MAG: hypothetical protein ACR2OD_03190 [Gaiellaceae bacterium]